MIDRYPAYMVVFFQSSFALPACIILYSLTSWSQIIVVLLQADSFLFSFAKFAFYHQSNVSKARVLGRKPAINISGCMPIRHRYFSTSSDASGSISRDFKVRVYHPSTTSYVCRSDTCFLCWKTKGLTPPSPRSRHYEGIYARYYPTYASQCIVTCDGRCRGER